MKAIQISDELYDRLKKRVVDPFDDTPEFVIHRLIDIVDKAKGMGLPWDAERKDAPRRADCRDHRTNQRSALTRRVRQYYEDISKAKKVRLTRAN
ncbi:MAG: hypothetical protein ACYTBJ_23475 [Planctomycetota bacterium]|jgi:hypothetical protein